MHIRPENLFYLTNLFIDLIEVINTTLNKLRCYNILLQSRHLNILHFLSTITTDTSHIPSVITLAKYLSK